MSFRLQIIGGGNMGEALLRGLIESDWASKEELHVVESNTKVFVDVHMKETMVTPSDVLQIILYHH